MNHEFQALNFIIYKYYFWNNIFFIFFKYFNYNYNY